MKEITLETLKRYYFTVKELKAFCSKHQISLSSGDRKLSIINKIESYLKTGKVPSLPKIKKQKRGSLADDELIGEGFVFSREGRRFFEKTLDPNFKCSVPLLAWVKKHPEKTIGDLKQAYLDLKKNKEKRDIAPQFEYNAFTRDFFAANPKATRQECIEAWKKARTRTTRKYSDFSL